jgi:hypothetical protein
MKRLGRKPRSKRGRVPFTAAQRKASLAARKKQPGVQPKWDRRGPIVITETGKSYFTALCATLKIIDDKARDKGVWHLEQRHKKIHDADGTLIGFEQEFTGKILPEIDTGERFVAQVLTLSDRFEQARREELFERRQRKAVV